MKQTSDSGQRTDIINATEKVTVEEPIVIKDTLENAFDDATENLAEFVEKNKVYKLYRPVTIFGKLYTEFTLDFDKLTGNDMERIAKMSRSGTDTFTELSKTYLSHVAAEACGIKIHEFRQLSIKDATSLTMMAQVFLMSAGSGTTSS